MIVERTHYYAKPGQRDAVLANRRRACEVRVAIGLPAGTIRVKADPAADGPDVAWECGFASREAHQADLDARAKSADFEAVRATMRALTQRFERLVEERAAGAKGWTGDVALDGVAVVPHELDFRSGPHELKGYLFLPPGTGPFPCMIYNHGSGLTQGSEDAVQPGIAAALMSWGIACFYPHRHGYGNSPGPDWRSECPAETFSPEYNRQIIARLDRESADVIAAFHFLRDLPGILPDRIGVMGSSFGGVNTLLSASKEPGFRCAVEFAGAAMNWDRNADLAQFMIAAAKRVTMPIFFIQAENDFSIRPTKELAAALAGKPNVEAKIYPPLGITKWEGHLLAGRAPQIWGPDVRRFLERWL
jgi:dienelactone hydrolase